MTNGPTQDSNVSSDGSRIPTYSDPAVQRMLEDIVRVTGRAFSLVAQAFVRIFDGERQLDVYTFEKGQRPVEQVGTIDLGQTRLIRQGTPEREPPL